MFNTRSACSIAIFQNVFVTYSQLPRLSVRQIKSCTYYITAFLFLFILN
ncbi:hypothetical protein EFM7_1303 [Enterococcus faecalis M7]|nr:hypothetical protein EFM7_1303 [Enterococcus faecalis M7]